MVDSPRGAAAPPTSGAVRPGESRWRRLAGMQELGLVGVILVLGAFLTIFGGSTSRVVTDRATGKQYRETTNKFLNVDRLVTLAKNTSFVAVMAVGATTIIVSGGIDLSVAGIYVLSGLAGAAFLHWTGPSGGYATAPTFLVVPLAVLICLSVGSLCGLVNGLGVVGLGLHPFIITLGAMGMYRGLAFVTTNAQSISNLNRSFVDGFISYKVNLGDGGFIYPVPLVILLIVAAAGRFLHGRTTTGRKLYAIGGNELAARYSGLDVDRLKVLAFVLGGLGAGVAAMINIGYHGSASSGDGAGYELEVIAAAVVGGASLSGGRGTALGAVLGALIIRLIVDGIVILGLSQNYSQIIVGAVIVAAAALDARLTVWRKRVG
ncbi:MAG TPA: ABC transporter permease [Pirellulales bacterium]